MITKLKRMTSIAVITAMLLTLLVGCNAASNKKNTENNPDSDAILDISILPAGPEDGNESSGEADIMPESDKREDQTEEDITDNEDQKVAFYLEKLKDKSFTDTYGDGEEPKVWYTAAEELGMLGKKSIPGLIEKLDTDDDYERALALYALLLASQDEEVKAFTDGEYIDVTLDFNPETHPEMIDKAMAWWNKYKDNF